MFLRFGLAEALASLAAGMAVCSLAAGPQAAPTPDADGFVPLFNGRDLSGWVNVNCAPETFTVRDGMIHCDGIPTGALRTARTWTNFVLELEWRHLKSGGNAGVFIWSGPLPAVGQPFLRAIEVQVLDHGYGKSDWFTTHGDVFPIHGSRMKPFAPSRGDRSFPRESRSKGTPEWNHYRIVATNGVLRLSVNGAEVSGGTDCNWAHGHIALESEGGIVDWRNLRIRELPGGTGSPGGPVADPTPWDALYDGRSLRGWETNRTPAEAWKPSDWTLRSPAGTPGSDVLWSAAIPAGAGIFIDWKWEKPAEAKGQVPLVLGTPDNQLMPLPPITREIGDRWTRLELRRTPEGYDIFSDGTPAGALPVPPRPLRVGLRPVPGGVTVANPFVERPRR